MPPRGSHQRVWQARVVGSLLVMPVYAALLLGGRLPLANLQLLIFPTLALVYFAASRSRDGRSAVVWPLHLCEGVALFVRETGGAASPFQAVAYPWLLGSARRSRSCTTARAPPSSRFWARSRRRPCLSAARARTASGFSPS